MPQTNSSFTMPETSSSAFRGSSTLALIPIVLVIVILAIASGADKGTLAPVGSSYWPIPKGIGLYLHHRPDMQSVLFLLYLATACVIGSLAMVVCFAVVDVDNSALPRLLLPLAGFIPGYLILICLNRMVTLFITNDTAKIILPLVYVATASVLGRLGRLSVTRPSIRELFACIVLSVGLFFVFLILQIQLDNSGHVIGDAVERSFPMLVHGFGLSPGEHFPIFLQHYDEMMFLFPLLGQDGRDARFVESFWLLYSLGKASAFTVAMLTIFVFCRNAMASALAAAYLLFGCGYLYVGNYLLMFDAGNPLRFNLHMGRIILAILPLVILGLGASGRFRLQPRGVSILVLCALIGMGASALSLSLALLSVSICVGLAIVSLPLKPETILFSATVLLASLINAYAQIDSSAIGWFFLAGIVFAAIVLVPDLVQSFPRLSSGLAQNGILKATAAYFVGYGTGLMFLGNFASQGILNALGVGEIRTLISLANPIPPFAIGTNPFCGGSYSDHCGDLGLFMTKYGLVLLLPWFSIFLLLYRQLRGNGEKSASGMSCTTAAYDDSVRLAWSLKHAKIMLVVLYFLVSGFFLWDFTNGAIDMSPENLVRWLPVWLKSRFVEPWAYAALAFSLSIVWLRAGARLKILILTFLAWQVLAYPFFAETALHQVFLRNLSYLSSALQ